jgi:hypothetical protein
VAEATRARELFGWPGQTVLTVLTVLTVVAPYVGTLCKRTTTIWAFAERVSDADDTDAAAGTPRTGLLPAHRKFSFESARGHNGSMMSNNNIPLRLNGTWSSDISRVRGAPIRAVSGTHLVGELRDAP